MPSFSRCLALINTRSGAREGRQVFASALQQYLDKAGIIHRDVLVPEKDVRHALLTYLPSVDNLIICGGDGTISSVVNVLAATYVEAQSKAARADGKDGVAVALSQQLLSRPIALVPTGLQNSIAHSLGVSSAERSVSQFVMGRADAVPVWRVSLNGGPLRYVCSYVAVGTYAHTVSRFHSLEAVGDEYVALPSLGRHKFKAAAFVSSVLQPHDPTLEPWGATLVMRDPPTCSTSTLARTSSADGTKRSVMHTFAAPLRMLVASQMPLQHSGYSLAPDATYRHGTLSVTVATEEAGRLRMWHLLRHEACQGSIVEEDGVATHQGVDAITLTLGTSLPPQSQPATATAAEGVAGRASDGAAANREGLSASTSNKDSAATTALSRGEIEASEMEPQEQTALLFLDGEATRVPMGSVVTVERVPGCTLPFLIC